ncbi:alginate export family protein [Fulvivirgaceae bacterium BMA10]|uniref:Alginate export family protein n=1 Tax=Splendidivirga corallicola TaxID=3051826 RepID=A0ABT8KW14_9BACT|nr:alginate export family protein [Fulvivirgaceae bacterium BMA10]
MKNSYLKLICLFCLGCLSLKDALAQLTFSGEIRPRTELRHGFKKPAFEDQEVAFFTEQRTRLMLQYTLKKYEFKLSLQDVRIWGSVDQVFKNDPSLTNIHEAWGKYNFNKNVSLKVGRQELNYDNARILGNLAWAAQSRSHDLAKFIYTGKEQTIHLGVAFNQDANTPEFGKLASTYYSTVKNYKTMQFLWYHKNFTKGALSLLVLNNGVQIGTDSLSSVNFSQTAGLTGSVELNKIALDGEFYYQVGKDQVDRNISAWMASLNASLKLGTSVIKVGGDYLSGTDQNDIKNHSFTPLYGTNHKFYGLMDYFFVGNPHDEVGLADYYVKTKFKTGDRSSLLTHLHYFSATATIPDPLDINRSMPSGLGVELDAIYDLNVSKEVNFKFGYSQMFGTRSMEVIKGGDKNEFNAWAWAMLTFKPVFIEK